MQLATKTHIVTPTRSRIIEKSTYMRSAIVFLLVAGITVGGVGYCALTFPTGSTVENMMMGGLALFGLTCAGILAYFDFIGPRELDIAVIGDTVHLSVATGFEPGGATRFPLKNVEEVYYSALGGLRLQVVDKGRMKLPKLGTHEMRESMAIWFAEMAEVELLR